MNGVYLSRVSQLSVPHPTTELIVPTASSVLDDGLIVEIVFRPDLRRTLFAICSAGRWTL